MCAQVHLCNARCSTAPSTDRGNQTPHGKPASPKLSPASTWYSHARRPSLRACYRPDPQLVQNTTALRTLRSASSQTQKRVRQNKTARHLITSSTTRAGRPASTWYSHARRPSLRACYRPDPQLAQNTTSRRTLRLGHSQKQKRVKHNKQPTGHTDFCESEEM